MARKNRCEHDMVHDILILLSNKPEPINTKSICEILTLNFQKGDMLVKKLYINYLIGSKRAGKRNAKYTIEPGGLMWLNLYSQIEEALQ